MIYKYTAIILLTIIQHTAFCENITINIEEGKSIIDEDLNLIVCNKNISEYSELVNVDEVLINISNTTYIFSSIPSSIIYGEQYTIQNNGQSYLLFFSYIPLLNIYADSSIVNEPKVGATFILSDTTNNNPIISYCGIEIRGGFSQTYPKNTFDLELWEDELGIDNNKIPLLGMRNDDDWILLGMYNEPLRIRNTINHQLWQDIHTPYYINEEPNAKSGIDTRYVELSINDEYLGIYALAEQVDKPQLKLHSYNNTIRGELYKGSSWGAPSFTLIYPINNEESTWAGFDLKYPKAIDTTDWSKVYDFVDLVMNSEEEDFNQNISNEINLQNFIDYFIFLNLLRATDNTGKNIYLAKYKQNEPYFYVPWDLDGTFGTIWTGQEMNIYDDILDNELYSRLLQPENEIFNQAASERWFSLRQNIITIDNIFERFTTNYDYLNTNLSYDREVLKWGEETLIFSNLDYTYTWLENRLIFLDHYFDHTILKDKKIISQTPKFIASPNPITSKFIIKSEVSFSHYKIHNTLGQIVYTGNNTSESFDISNLPKGIYYLSIINNQNRILVQKIIKN